MTQQLPPTARLSAPDWCFLKSGVEPAAHYARLKALGFQGVEMVEPANRASARAAGLEIVNLSGPGMQKGLNRRSNHDTLVPQIRDCIADAAANHIGHVIVFSGNRDGLADSEGKAMCVEALRTLAPDAEKAGVTLVLEMLNGFDHADYQADRSAFGFDVINSVASPAVRVLYDIYHLARMGDDPLRDIISHLPVITHLHCAEAPRRTAPQASGTIAYQPLYHRVIEAGYTGYWGLEFIPGEDVYGELAAATAAFT